MSDYKYGKAYDLKQWDEHGTRFRTDGRSVQVEVEVPLTAKQREAHDFINTMQQIVSGLIDPIVDIRTTVTGFEGSNQVLSEEYLVISGWRPHLSLLEQQASATLQYH